MSLTFKDNRNGNLRTSPKHAHHLPLLKRLHAHQRHLAQRAEAVGKDLENIEVLEQEGDMQYFELVNRRISGEKALKEAKEKIEKLSREVKYTELVSHSRYKHHRKGEQKIKDMDFRNSVYV